MLTAALAKLERTAWNHAPSWLLTMQRARAQAYWRAKACGCEYSEVIYRHATPPAWNNVLEFGANWGGNLAYILERHPDAKVVGVDINPAVRGFETRFGGYRGIVGDETALEQFEAGSFDLAFTVSVLDHIPSARVVEIALGHLIRSAHQVLLLEPFIEGIYGDVSGWTRRDLGPDLPDGHKRFAPHSYLWDYEGMLTRLGVRWEKQPVPLHRQSLGPFYCLYKVEA
jgi:hypothetical protein